jgi:hypothetical protein
MAADDDGGGDADEEAIVRDPEGVELLEEIANYLDKDDILFRSPRWLENFRDMKQAAIDPSIRTVRSIGRHCILTSKC